MHDTCSRICAHAVVSNIWHITHYSCEELTVTEVNELKWRGGNTDNPIDSTLLFFDDGDGMYNEIWDKMDDWKDSELGDLLFGTTRVVVLTSSTMCTCFLLLYYQ